MYIGIVDLLRLFAVAGVQLSHILRNSGWLSSGCIVASCLLSTNVFAWRAISISFYGNLVTAWVPESEQEQEVTQLAGSTPVHYGNGVAMLGVAYIFQHETAPLSLPMHHDFSGHSQALLPLPPQFAKEKLGVDAFPQLGFMRQNHFRSAPRTIKPFGNSKRKHSHVLRKDGADGGELYYNPGLKAPVYCKEFAYSPLGCLRECCKHDHIKEVDFKKRVVCFRQICGGCRYFSDTCHHLHLKPQHLTQLQSARANGVKVPLIFCNSTHSNVVELEQCPYLHFMGSDPMF